ncbi:hemerythrin domain-containing protein [Polaromonas sp. P2-4]|nr:hemerythrin domain-containing protein [Polaromonas sp. P2-4]
MMLYYIREYPEQVHHPKEDQYLFARLRDRTSKLDETLAELESQHTQGEALVRELERALTRYELEGSSAFLAFRDLVEKYAKFYFSHMRLEEEVILPAARRLLTPEDWTVVDAAFAGNRDPFAGADLKGGLEKLFLLIVNIIPAPDGLGPAI